MDDNQELNNLHQPLTSSDLRAASGDSTPEPKKPKKGITKKTLALSIILTLLLTACITSVIWFFITNNSKPSNSSTSSTNCPTETEKQETISSNTTTQMTTAEVEITDVSTKNELNEKLALLHFTDKVYSNNVIKGGGYPVAKYIQYFYENDNPEIFKLYTAIMKDYRAQGYRGNVDANSVTTTYQDLYGATPIHQDVAPDLCPHFTYDATNNQYVEQPGCGGVWFTTYGVQMEDYLQKGDEAYVDAKLVTMAGNPQNNTCTVYAGFHSNEEIDSGGLPSVYTVEGSDCSQANDYEKGEDYQFTFKKNSDGSYYFDSVEKL